MSAYSTPNMRIFLLATLLVVFSATAQDDFPVNGTRKKHFNHHAFINATLHIDAENVMNKGYLIVKEGKVVYAGHKTKLPKDCVVHDLDGKHIYPSFIELYSSYGMPEVKKLSGPNPQYHTLKKGPFGWNQAIKPEVDAYELYSKDEKAAKELRNQGFGVVLSHQRDGIVRGTSVLSSLGDQKENKTLILPKAAAHYSFQKGKSTQAYPGSLMGCIALLRQTYLDAQWYGSTQEEHQQNMSLQAFNNAQELPQIFEAKNKYSVLRADKVGDEFGVQYIIKGNGDEYQLMNEIKATQSSLIIPVNFPKPYDVADPYDAMHVSLEDLKHWELAPSNPKFLHDQQVTFAFTSDGLKKKATFLKNVRKAVKFGLTKEQALKALTQIPAEYLNAYDKVGSLHEGKLANFIITSDELFEKGGAIYENWVQGDQFVIKDANIIDVRGEYNLNVNQKIRVLKVNGTVEKPTAKLSYKIVADSVSKSGDLVIDPSTGHPFKTTKKKKVKVNIEVKDKLITLSYSLKEGHYSLSGNINFDSGSWDGRGQQPNGEWVSWSSIRRKKFEKKKESEVKKDSVEVGKFAFPQMAFGWDSLPEQQPILIKNATVWTLEEQGTMQATDVLIRGGKIVHIGKIADVVDAKTIVIDGTGKHVSPGIIDEHSHIAIERGVNEGTHAVTAEVRIGDVVKSNDINIYRQLSGGVTTAQLLHGSANPVGGQAALIKLRWGLAPDSMKVENAPGFIKFALGENVKQSNWGSHMRRRFPQTRMGVEQVYYEAFIRAKEYEAEWKAFNELPKKKKTDAVPPRKDLQMDALLEILNKERFISCHSYVQSEINMLMHVADSMGFTLNTFTHILEGYKVADKMKAHGAGGSTFSDWWAYKFEVNDAIPHNASLLNQMGIVTAINSDDAEMGRRLNQEAAKGLKYGGMSEEEALKMVTLNPAKLLHVDDRVGSLKVGKDADIVIWSNHPLSVYSKAEQTIIDGIIYYDHLRDVEMRKEIQKERARIISKMMEEKNGGAATQKVKKSPPKVHVCGTFGDDGN